MIINATTATYARPIRASTPPPIDACSPISPDAALRTLRASSLIIATRIGAPSRVTDVNLSKHRINHYVATIFITATISMRARWTLA
jgi:hypothetical protein